MNISGLLDLIHIEFEHFRILINMLFRHFFTNKKPKEPRTTRAQKYFLSHCSQISFRSPAISSTSQVKKGSLNQEDQSLSPRSQNGRTQRIATLLSWWLKRCAAPPPQVKNMKRLSSQWQRSTTKNKWMKRRLIKGQQFHRRSAGKPSRKICQ